MSLNWEGMSPEDTAKLEKLARESAVPEHLIPLLFNMPRNPSEARSGRILQQYSNSDNNQVQKKYFCTCEAGSCLIHGNIHVVCEGNDTPTTGSAKKQQNTNSVNNRESTLMSRANSFLRKYCRELGISRQLI